MQYQKTFPLSLISADAPNKHKTLHFILILIFFCVFLLCVAVRVAVGSAKPALEFVLFIRSYARRL